MSWQSLVHPGAGAGDAIPHAQHERAKEGVATADGGHGQQQQRVERRHDEDGGELLGPRHLKDRSGWT